MVQRVFPVIIFLFPEVKRVRFFGVSLAFLPFSFPTLAVHSTVFKLKVTIGTMRLVYRLILGAITRVVGLFQRTLGEDCLILGASIEGHDTSVYATTLL